MTEILADFLVRHKLFRDANTEYDSRTSDYKCKADFTVLIDSTHVRCHSVKDYSCVYEQMKLGRYLNKAYDLSPATITHMCEKIKSLIETPNDFKIISGNDIKSAYYRVNYVPNHYTLSRSCMRYKKCQSNNYFQIYADTAKMLIMTPKRGSRIMGRALLWPYGDSYLMDRVYTAEPYIEHQFFNYAKEHNFFVLRRNRYVCPGETQEWLTPDSNYAESVAISLTIPVESYENYPYIDSFCYLTEDKKILSTFPIDRKGYICHNIDGDITTWIKSR